MDRPLCRYCGKPMDIAYIEYIVVYYKCGCEGYKKEQKLEDELRALERQVSNKKMELGGHKAASLYETTLRELNKKIYEIKHTYEDR